MPILVKRRNYKGDAFTIQLLPRRLHRCFLSRVGFNGGFSSRVTLARGLLIGVSRLTGVAMTRRNGLGRALSGMGIGNHPVFKGDRTSHEECTSFLTAAGSRRPLYSPAKDHHCLYLQIPSKRFVSGDSIVGCSRLCTRVVCRLHSGRAPC